MSVEVWDRGDAGTELAPALATIHALAFAADGRAWSGTEILALIGDPAVGLCLARRSPPRFGGPGAPAGFALWRVAADEAEILTVAVLPEARRRGLGAGLLTACEDAAHRRGAARMFLEVSEANIAARALYGGAGYAETGRRKSYYLRADGSRADAITMVKLL
jgi:ribosomal-protein-alanine N-acetyltransferase